ARFGNGIVEITARGSLQVRGLTSESTGGLAAQVDALGIAVRSGLPVETSPLAGLDRDEAADPRKLAREIRERAEALGLTSRLGPKVSVTVDGSGVLGLGGMIADVKLEAVAGEELVERAEGRGICEESAITWLLRVGGSSSTARVLGRFSQSEAAEITLRVLAAIAEHGPAARARDLGDAELAAITGREP
ncbi:precorrin-3B synthase, partial [Nitratireductor sp. GCM10026969]